MYEKKIGPTLGGYLGKKISIFLGSGVNIQGILVGFDQFMNLVVENSSITGSQKEEKLGTTIIRGCEVFVLELSEH